MGGFSQPLPGTSLFRTTLGITQEAPASAFPGAVSPQVSVTHHPSNASQQGTGPETPGNSQLSLPQWFIHPGTWDGAQGLWPQPGPALGTPQAVGMMQGGKTMEKPKTTEIPIKAWM